MKRYLILCTGNSCRSQMLEGYLRHFGGSTIVATSAGVETHGLNPLAVKVMSEDGVDISGHQSNHVDEFSGLSFDTVITVCDHAREVCPVFPSIINQIHRSFPDPAKAKGSPDEVLNEFRKVRDLLKEFAMELVLTSDI